MTMTGSGASGSPRPGVSSSRLPRYSPRCSTAWTSSRATARRPHDQSVIDADFAELLRWLRHALSSMRDS